MHEAEKVLILGDIYGDKNTIKYLKLMYIYLLQPCTYDINSRT